MVTGGTHGITRHGQAAIRRARANNLAHAEWWTPDHESRDQSSGLGNPCASTPAELCCCSSAYRDCGHQGTVILRSLPVTGAIPEPRLPVRTPPSRFQVEFLPPSPYQFCSTNKRQCEQFHGQPGNMRALINLDGPEQRGHLLHIYTGQIGLFRWPQNVAGLDLGGRIALRIAVCNAEPKYLPGRFQGPLLPNR